jgi:hypothetical protein
MKLLIANGCSHTAGSDIDPNNLRYCAKSAWPKFVADHYGINWINMAEGGSGNEQISRSTILNISRLIDIDKFDPKDLIVTILWSGFDRYEYWSERHQMFRSFSMSANVPHYDPGPYIRKYVELRSLVETENYSYYKNLYYMYVTAKFLESYGIKYYFANGLSTFIPLNEFNDTPELTREYQNMLILYGQTRINNHLGFFNNSELFKSYLKDIPYSPYGQYHWGEEGQKKYAEYFIEHMEK